MIFLLITNLLFFLTKIGANKKNRLDISLRLNMKYLIVLTFVFLSQSWIVGSAKSADCTVNSGVITDTSGQCENDAQAMGLNLHGVWLCQQAPTVSNYQTVCEQLFYSAVAQQVRVERGGEAGVAPNVELSLPLGTYTHSVLLVENKLYSKGVITFSANRRGKSDTPGTTCWTLEGEGFDEANGFANLPIDCGLAANANPGYMVAEKDSWTAPSAGATNFERVADDKTYAVNYAYALSAETTQSTSDNDTRYLLGVSAYKAGYRPVISNTTSRIKMSFALTGNGKIRQKSNGHGSCNAGGGDSCVTAIMQRGFEFLVEAE